MLFFNQNGNNNKYYVKDLKKEGNELESYEVSDSSLFILYKYCIREHTLSKHIPTHLKIS